MRIKRACISITAALLLSFLQFLAPRLIDAQQTEKVPTRREIPVEFTWDLSILFGSDEEWEAAYSRASEKIDEISRFKGQLDISGTNLFNCLTLKDEIGVMMDRLSSYANRKRDVDLSNTTYQAMNQRMQSLQTKRFHAIAFVEPEITAIDNEVLAKLTKQETRLSLYSHYLEDLARMKVHILPVEQEELLSLLREVSLGTEAAFGMLVNADFRWGNIQDDKGQDVEMSRTRYLLYMSSPDRRLRRDAYKELYVPFGNHLNTLTSLLVTNLRKDIFYTRARQYDNSLEAALYGPNIPTTVYRNLISTVNGNLEPLQRWAAIKKHVLNVEELHPYDTYAPLFPESERHYTYQEAQAIIRGALEPLGPEVADILDRAFSERWIDVYENVGKEDGAYSSGVYGVHPYILMNFNGTLSSVFTLAHELGHSIHSYLSSAAQPYVYSSYATFNAEVASITNEALLMNYLLENAGTDVEKLTLLRQYIQDIGSTFYRQARFAEFELLIHEKIEHEEPLTHETMNRLFGDIYQKYWGPEMVVDEEERLSWARIPHFYYNYYVYSYATSFAASQLIARKIREEGKPAVDDYLRFLRSGASDYPIELLKIAGVDMSTPTPIEATAARMDELLDQMEKILSKQ